MHGPPHACTGAPVPPWLSLLRNHSAPASASGLYHGRQLDVDVPMRGSATTRLPGHGAYAGPGLLGSKDTTCPIFIAAAAVWISGIVQTIIYIDFFYYYFRSWKNNEKL